MIAPLPDACKCEILRNEWSGRGRTKDKGRWRRFCVRWHVYMSVGKSKKYIAIGSGAKAGRGLCVLASL